MVSYEEVAAAFNAAAEPLGVGGDKVGLSRALSSLTFLAVLGFLASLPAIIKFVRPLSQSKGTRIRF